MEGKRSRAVNFSSAEEDMIVKLVLKKMDILQNKNLGANSSQIKAKAWEEIAIEFNCRCPNHVSINDYFKYYKLS